MADTNLSRDRYLAMSANELRALSDKLDSSDYSVLSDAHRLNDESLRPIRAFLSDALSAGELVIEQCLEGASLPQTSMELSR
jgi:hypothetical protein